MRGYYIHPLYYIRNIDWHNFIQPQCIVRVLGNSSGMGNEVFNTTDGSYQNGMNKNTRDVIMIHTSYVIRTG